MKGRGKKDLFPEFIEYIADIVAVNAPVCQQQRWKERDRDQEIKKERKKARQERKENEGVVQTASLLINKQLLINLCNLRFHCKFSSSFLLE